MIAKINLTVELKELDEAFWIWLKDQKDFVNTPEGFAAQVVLFYQLDHCVQAILVDDIWYYVKVTVQP